VKMIYIDPPYNTGNDFIYRDDYSEPRRAYLEKTGQIDAEGNVLTSNPETSGRYHSDWLTMMYPRLFLARQLLREDGVIFVSIDDNEVHHLRLLMNEILGEEQFVADIAVVNNLKGRSDRRYIATAHEHLLMYTMPEFLSKGLSLTPEKIAEYDQVDEEGNRFQWRDLRKRGGADTREERPNLFFPLYLNQETGELSVEPSGDTDVTIYPRKSDGTDGCWRWGKDRVASHIRQLKASRVRDTDRWNVYYRVYLKIDGEPRTRKPKSVWIGSRYSTDLAQRAFKELLPGLDIDAPPKAVGFVKDIVEQSTGGRDICLDFFAGTCTTAQAILELNHEDGGERRFVMVQLSEPLAESQTLSDGLAVDSMSEIGKERIRRVIATMREGNENGQLSLDLRPDEDLGFKVFKLAPSTFRQWEPPEGEGAEALEEQLALFDRGVEEGADPTDVIYEVILKLGYSLNARIEPLDVESNRAYRVVDEIDKTDETDQTTASFYVCLDDELADETIDALPLDKETTFVCLDTALDDSQKVNLAMGCLLKVI
jgi:adenine-specific DNA-methyltransferase